MLWNHFFFYLHKYRVFFMRFEKENQFHVIQQFNFYVYLIKQFGDDNKNIQTILILLMFVNRKII